MCEGSIAVAEVNSVVKVYSLPALTSQVSIASRPCTVRPSSVTAASTVKVLSATATSRDRWAVRHVLTPAGRFFQVKEKGGISD